MKKKQFCFLLAVLFAALISTPGYAYAATNDNYDYTVYDMETGEVTYHRIDDPVAITDKDLETITVEMQMRNEPELMPNVIIDGDDREPVTNTTNRPYSYTVRIVADGGIASGVVIGSCAILTAAHVVYDANGYTQTLTITPAQNGSSAPYGSITVTSADLYVPYAYTSAFPESAANDYYPGSDYDWAIIYLDASDDIGNYTGWPALCSQAAAYLNQSIKCVGYSGGGTTMYESHGTIQHVYDLTFTGDWDAVGGNSGCPILVNDPTAGWTLYGIHTATYGKNGDSYDQDSTYSRGRKITGTLWYMCNGLGGT